MEKLTKRQTEILDVIRNAVHRTGSPPTRLELCEIFGFRSPNAAEDHLKALARKGYIELTPGRSRGIRLLEELNDFGLPIVGKVAAGSPILALENIEDTVPVESALFTSSPDYLLRVEGESMINIGIMDGDLLAVQSANTAHNGEIVVARVDDEVTVKRYKRTSESAVQLIAENDHFSPINVDLSSQDFHIEGKAVGVIRQNI